MACSSAAASQAAVAILLGGGNAADAAIAASAVLTMTSADAPAAYAAAMLWRRSSDEVELVTAAPGKDGVPGVVELWFELFQAQATLAMERLLQPALSAAASEWRAALERLIDLGRDGYFASLTAAQEKSLLRRAAGITDDDDELKQVAWQDVEPSVAQGTRVFTHLAELHDGPDFTAAAKLTRPHVIVANHELALLLTHGDSPLFGVGRLSVMEDGSFAAASQGSFVRQRGPSYEAFAPEPGAASAT